MAWAKQMTIVGTVLATLLLSACAGQQGQRGESNWSALWAQSKDAVTAAEPAAILERVTVGKGRPEWITGCDIGTGPRPDPNPVIGRSFPADSYRGWLQVDYAPTTYEPSDVVTLWFSGERDGDRPGKLVLSQSYWKEDLEFTETVPVKVEITGFNEGSKLQVQVGDGAPHYAAYVYSGGDAEAKSIPILRFYPTAVTTTADLLVSYRNYVVVFRLSLP